jgi:hypothetical protein
LYEGDNGRATPPQRSFSTGMALRQSLRETHMLAEKFFLVLETLISHTNLDRAPRMESASRQVPIKLPRKDSR